VRAWAPGRVARIGPFEISPYPAEHPVEAYALTVAAPSDRDDATATLTYTGDGDLGPGVSTAAEGVSLLLAEAGFLEGRDQVAGVHMTACQAGLLAAEAGVGELVLTHIAPWDNPEGAVRAARRVYGGPVRAARPGAVHRV
jgi:ribonuclease BN (tRNA processing enzyme)